MKRLTVLVTTLAAAMFVAIAGLPSVSVAQQEVPCGDEMGCGGGGGDEGGGAPCVSGTVRRTYLCSWCRNDTRWISFPTHYEIVWQGDGTLITKTCQNGSWQESWSGLLCGACNQR